MAPGGDQSRAALVAGGITHVAKSVFGRYLGWFFMAGKKKNGAQKGSPTLNLVVNSGSATAESDAEEVEALDDMEDGQLFRAMDEVRQVEGAKAEVYRVAPADKVGHCRSYPVSVFSLEKVTADYGPGKYRVKFKGPGDKYIKGGGTFDIAEGLNTGAAAPAGGGAVESVLALFKAERERDEQDRAKRNDKWLQWATLLAPVLGPKLLDIIGGSRGMGPRDLVGMMKDMRELQAPQADLNAQFTQVLTLIQGAKELVGDTSEKTGSTWVDLLRDFISSPAAGALASAIPGMGSGLMSPPSSASIASVRPPANAVPQIPAGSSACAPSTAPGSAANPDMLQQLQWLRHTLGQLINQAERKNSNPRLYGEVMLDNLPPFIKEQDLLDRLRTETWFAELQQIDGRVAQHQEWFQRFRDYVVKALVRKLAKSDPPEPPPGQGLPGRNQPMVQEGSEFE
jgi:hypothetical protein